MNRRREVAPSVAACDASMVMMGPSMHDARDAFVLLFDLYLPFSIAIRVSAGSISSVHGFNV